MTTLWLPPAIKFVLQDQDLWNTLLSLSGQRLPVGSRGYEWSFKPCERPIVGGEINSPLLAELGVKRLKNPSFALCRAFNFPLLFESPLTIEDFRDLPLALRDALYEGMVGWLMMNVMAQRPDDVSMRKVAEIAAFTQGELPHDLQWFDVQVTLGDVEVAHWQIAMDRSDLLALLQRIAISPHHDAPSPLIERLTAPVDVVIGSLVILLRELKDVVPGALVVLAEQDEDSLNLQMRDMIFRLILTDEGWCCAERRKVSLFAKPSSYRRLEASAVRTQFDKKGAVAPADENGAVAAESRYDPLRIAIDFDIGRMMVPISALANWREGALITLELPENQEGVEVSIRANGDLIGSGTLVRIDDRLAVRIQHVFL